MAVLLGLVLNGKRTDGLPDGQPENIMRSALFRWPRNNNVKSTDTGYRDVSPYQSVTHLTRTYYTIQCPVLLQLEFQFPYTATENYDTVDIACALCDIRIVAIVIETESVTCSS